MSKPTARIPQDSDAVKKENIFSMLADMVNSNKLVEVRAGGEYELFRDASGNRVTVQRRRPDDRILLRYRPAGARLLSIVSSPLAHPSQGFDNQRSFYCWKLQAGAEQLYSEWVNRIKAEPWKKSNKR